MTEDPLKHLIGYGRRNPATGMLHGHIHYPDGKPPVPSGCRWCGQEKRLHGRWWRPGKGYHSYEMPTQAQIKARMRARRAARSTVSAEPYCTGDRCADCEQPGPEDTHGEDDCCEATCGNCPRVNEHDHCRLAPGSEEDAQYCDQHGEGRLNDRTPEAERRYQALRRA